MYTDNHREIGVVCFTDVRSVEIAWWQPAEVRFLDSSNNVLFLAQLAKDGRQRFDAPDGQAIRQLWITPPSEFLLLELCVEP